MPVPAPGGNGSTADIAAATGWPVVLVLDVAGQAQSAAAVTLGFARYRDDVRIAGVILNKIASTRHEALVGDGFARIGITVFGAIGRDTALTLPERHLGLVQAQEDSALAGRLAMLADLVERDIDLTALQAAAHPTQRQPIAASPRLAPPGQRIALARDVAFSFIYPHLLAAWRAAGADIVTFSPLADEPPDPCCDVAWLPGGYPELHAGQLAAASRFAAGIRAFAQTRAVHGECGGYMTLGAGLVDAAGTRHAMLGLLGLETDFAQRRLHLGYRTATLLAPIPGHAAGRMLRGHEFHYARVVAQPDPRSPRSATPRVYRPRKPEAGAAALPGAFSIWSIRPRKRDRTGVYGDHLAPRADDESTTPRSGDGATGTEDAKACRRGKAAVR